MKLVIKKSMTRSLFLLASVLSSLVAHASESVPLPVSEESSVLADSATAASANCAEEPSKEVEDAASVMPDKADDASVELTDLQKAMKEKFKVYVTGSGLECWSKAKQDHITSFLTTGLTNNFLGLVGKLSDSQADLAMRLSEISISAEVLVNDRPQGGVSNWLMNTYVATCGKPNGTFTVKLTSDRSSNGLKAAVREASVTLANRFQFRLARNHIDMDLSKPAIDEMALQLPFTLPHYLRPSL